MIKQTRIILNKRLNDRQALEHHAKLGERKPEWDAAGFAPPSGRRYRPLEATAFSRDKKKKARQSRALKGSLKPGFERIQGDNWCTAAWAAAR
jgi:hypothetical protein